MTEGHDQFVKASAKSDAPAASGSKHANRRRLLKAAAMTAPLMITLRGKPAHAQLSSLGSAGILYGPGAYVTQQDVNANPNVLTPQDIGKSIKLESNGKKSVLDDKTRRDQTKVETINVPNGPNNGKSKTFP